MDARRGGGTNLDLDTLEKLARAATSGPWTSLGGGTSIGVYTAFDRAKPIGEPTHIASFWHNARVPKVDGYANARYIAACDPQTILALIARVRGTPREERP